MTFICHFSYLEKTISGDFDIRDQDLGTVFAAVYENPSGVPVLFKFLQTKYGVLPN